MKVLYVIDSLGAGGAERSTSTLLPYLRLRGIDVSLVTMYRASEGSEDEVRDSGVDVTVLEDRTWIHKILALRRIILTESPDIVHTALFTSDVIGRLAAGATPTLVISSLTNVPRRNRPQLKSEPTWKRWLVDMLDLATARWFADRLHAVTSGVARMHGEAFPSLRSKISVVERGRDGSQLGTRSSHRRTAVRTRLGLDDDASVLLAVGRHENQKAHVDLIRAVARLSSNDASTVLLIAGRAGRATPEIEREIELYGLEDRVTFLGHRADIGDLLAAADVYVQSSLHEGAAGAVLEAMAVGTPIVATDVEGLEGVLEHERNSLLAPVRDPEKLSAQLARLLVEPDLSARLSVAARRDFEARFTLDRSADRMTKLYRDVIDSAVR